MKKALSILLVVLLTLALNGCNNSNLEKIQTTTSEQSDVIHEQEIVASDNDYEFAEMHDFGVMCESSGTFWSTARQTGTNVEYYIAFDSDKNTLCMIPSENTEVLSPFYDGLAAVRVDGGIQLINTDGEDVSHEYLNSENEVFLYICEDSTGITIWTAEDIETYASYDTVLRAKSIDGTIKQSWNFDELSSSFYDSANDLSHGVSKSRFKYLGKGFYCIYKPSDPYSMTNSRFIFDVRSGNVKNIGIAYGYSPLDDEIIAVTAPNDNARHHTAFAAYNITTGELAWEITAYTSSIYEMNEVDYTNGYGFSMGITEDHEKYAGFFDDKGHMVVDLMSSIPELYDNTIFIVDACMFKDVEYGIITVVNERGNAYVTLIDREGNMLFEPIRGHHGFEHYDYQVRRPYSDDFFCQAVYSRLPVIFGEDGTIYMISASGEETILPDGLRYAQYYDRKYYYIDDGCIMVDSYSEDTGFLEAGTTLTETSIAAPTSGPKLAASPMKDFVIENGVLKKYVGSGGDVVIPDSVTSIGNWAFSDHTSLTSVIIPNSVASIGEGAFSGCSELTAIQVDSGNETYTTSDGVLFNKPMSELMQYPAGKQDSSYTIPDSVKSVADVAFILCDKLTSVNIPNSVTSIGYGAFSECTSLTNVIIPNSVASIGEGAFSGCSELTAIQVDSGNETYTTSNGVLFNKPMSELIQYPAGKQDSSYTIPDSVKSVAVMAFISCDKLTNVNIPNNVASIGGNAFSGCTRLTSVTIPNSVTSIGEWTFNYCTALTSVTIPNSVTIIEEYAFDSCSSLTSMTIPNHVTSIGKCAFSDCTSLTSVIIPNSVVSIGMGALYGCPNLQDVYYGGPEAQWKSIDIGDINNEALRNVAIHYNSSAPQ